MDNSDRPNKRARTDAQLEQKRMVDRVKQKANRAESKTRLENIEKDVSFLRETIGNLVQQLNTMSPAIRSNVDSSTPSLNFGYGESSARASISDASSSSGRTTSQTEAGSNSNSQVVGFGSNPPSNAGNSDDISLPEVVECYCGLRHTDPSECVERRSFNLLFDSHRTLSQSPLTPVSFPLNPTLPNLLLQSIDDNPLTKLCGSTLRQFKTYDTKTLFGLYFLTYRLLRWRAHPNPQWYVDVPDIMKPTHIQNTEPHPVCLDFIPWPMLRNHLCLNQNTDARHSISLYLQCIRLMWPPEKELLVRDQNTGKIELHKDFEMIVCDARYWGVTDKWRAMFPHLLKHIE